MKPLFLGSHPAMDFLNTRPTPRGAPIELIGDGASYAAWLEGARLLHATTRRSSNVASAQRRWTRLPPKPETYGNGPVTGSRAGEMPPAVPTGRSSAA